jgi:FixJ family two-component response regulator
MPPCATIFIVDDDEDLRNSLKSLMESAGLPAEVFPSAEAFLAMYTDTRPGCLLLDVRMPGMGGLRLLEHLHTVGSPLPVIVFTGHGDVPMAVQALKCGAYDFVEKPAGGSLILARVRDALAANREKCAQEATRLAFGQRLAQLSPREREVLERVVAGASNRTIAREMGISDRTIEKHRENMMVKMRASSLAALIRMIVLYHDRGDAPSGPNGDARRQSQG